MKLRARGPNVADQSMIDAVVPGINLGLCGEHKSRRKPKTVTKVFEIMQEYCISDRRKRRRLKEMNEQKKSRNNERSHSKPWHADQTKNQKTVNSISEEEPRDSRHHSKGKNERDHRDDRSRREDRYHRKDRHQKGQRENGGRREKIPYYYFHGKDKGHWTNECPIAIEKKAELERQSALPAKPVNYTSQPPQQTSFPPTMWTPTPNWPVSYPVSNYNPSYTPPMPLPSQQTMPPPLQQPMPMLPALQYTNTWSRSSTPLPPRPKLEPG